MGSDKFGEAREMAASLRSGAAIREKRWRELAYWLAPHRGIFSGEDLAPRGERRNPLGLNHAACQAVLRGASGMTSGMTPRNISWFKPCFTDGEIEELSGARAWLDKLDTRMKDCLANGGFYQAIQAFNMDLLWAGCALLYCEKGEMTPLRFECPQIGTFGVSLDSDGRVEAVARDFTMTAAVLARKFGKNALSRATRQRLEKNPYADTRVTHLTRRRLEADAMMPFESLFWEDCAEGAFLSQGGFYEMPYFFTSWHDSQGPYGTGPGDDALADARQLDILEKNKLASLDKLTNPPVAAHHDLKEVMDLEPGGVTWVKGGERLEPILDLGPCAASLKYVLEEIGIVSQRLEQELMASIFASMPMDQRPRDMSATEFLERKREALQQLGPVISAYEPNVLTPMLFRVAQSLDRAALTPPVPESLANVPLFMKMDFISPMANALRQTGAETTRAMFQNVAMMVQATQNAEILDKLDLDQIVDELACGLGAPGSIVRADADVAKIRQQRAQAQAMQAQMQAQTQEAQMTQMNARALRDTAGAARDLAGGDNAAARDF